MDHQNPPQPVEDTQPTESESQQTPSVADPKPTTTRPKKSLWIIIAVSVLVLIVIGGVAAYLYNRSVATSQSVPTTAEPSVAPTSSPAPTSAWQTYTNATYNFAIDYPADWIADESDSHKGATFIPVAKSSTPDAMDSVSLYIGQKSGGYDGVPLAEYAKVAANKEIQNYNQLASFKEIVTTSGVVGYQTTWMLQSIADYTAPPSESEPIAYFAIAGDDVNLLRISLSSSEDLAIYEKMLTSFRFLQPTVQVSPKSTSQPAATATPVAATPTAVPTVTEEAVLKTVIKNAIVSKSGGSGSTLIISVSQINGDYAKGGASDDGGGGMWFAAKVNGVWKLVWDGNGVINCTDLTAYPAFPTSMIPECWDEAKQDSVKR